MACSRPFHFLQATKSQNVLTCKFTTNQLHADFITKEFKRCYEMGQLQVVQVLQSGAGITKRDNFVTKWGYYYKSSALQKATETNGGGQ